MNDFDNNLVGIFIWAVRFWLWICILKKYQGKLIDRQNCLLKSV
jgi:hypothetical protein